MAQSMVAERVMSADEIWSAMQTEMLRGIPMSDIIGGGDPKVVAVDLLNTIQRHVSVAPDAAVLDLGCGCGRIAAGLIETIGNQGRYTGIDIIPGLIQFATDKITSGHPNFRFFCREQENVTYNYFINDEGPARIASVSEVCENDSVDLAVAVSLFTHLDFDEAKDALSEIAASLKPSGRGYLTFFVLDHEAMEATRARGEHFTFQHESKSGRSSMEKTEDPNYAVGFTPQQLDELLEESGLRMVNRVPGSWCGLYDRKTYQDGIIVRKSV